MEEPLLVANAAPASLVGAWSMLAGAIILEVVGTTCMRLAVVREVFLLPAYVMYAASFWLFPYILRSLPVSVAYATWSAAGTVLVTAVSWACFGEPLQTVHLLCIGGISLLIVVLNVVP